MALKQGVVAHLFCGQKMVLILRNNSAGNVIDAGRWDSLTETMEPEDNDDFEAAMGRGFLEELGFCPTRLHFLGVTRAGHGFFVAFLSHSEVGSIKLDPKEGEKFDLFTLEEAEKLPLGGAVRNHGYVYRRAFENLTQGKLPKNLDELGLRELVPT